MKTKIFKTLVVSVIALAGFLVPGANLARAQMDPDKVTVHLAAVKVVAQNGSPLAGATVAGYWADGHGHEGKLQPVSTDRDGIAMISGPPVEEYIVTASARGFLPRTIAIYADGLDQTVHLIILSR